MVRISKSRYKKTAGLAPGTLVHIGERKLEHPRITIMDYDEQHFSEHTNQTVENCFSFRDSPGVTWINIDGIHDTALIETIGNHFGLHPLVQEDIVNTAQRPKIEEYDEYLYFVLKMLTYDEPNETILSEQVSIILGKGFVISFQEHQGDVFDAHRERIRNGTGRVRKMGADYLAYLLLDAIVDAYFPILEHLGDQVEELDERVMNTTSTHIARQIHRLRTELIYLKKPLWPLREMINTLRRTETSASGALVTDTLDPFLADVYDHTIQVLDSLEALRDMVGGLRDTYHASISNRMNEIMKVLTIISTLFIPITFIAGIYGMNFEIMPELKWESGYYMALGLMAAIVVAMLGYFRKQKWI